MLVDHPRSGYPISYLQNGTKVNSYTNFIAYTSIGSSTITIYGAIMVLYYVDPYNYSIIYLRRDGALEGKYMIIDWGL